MGDRRRYHTFVFDSARWDGFVLRDDDIIISTPAKCGTTWMQMLCALLVLRTPELPEPLATLSPWLEMTTRPLDEVRRDLDAQTHRRFIKSHTPFDGLPSDPDLTYVHVARDPRDVAQSWDNHMANFDFAALMERRAGTVGLEDLADLGITEPPPPPPEDPVDRFWFWMERDPDPLGHASLADLVENVATFWEQRDEPNVHLFHYGDLRADLPGQMARLAEALGVEPPDEALVEAATFEQMKGRADELAPNSDIGLFQSNDRFFDRARSGEWQEFLEPGDDDRYRRRIEALAPPDLAAWLHDGWHGSGGWPPGA